MNSLRAGLDKQTQKHGRFVGGYASGDSEYYILAFKHCRLRLIFLLRGGVFW